MKNYIKPLIKIGIKDISSFGGKASSLGEMLSRSIPVPPGFGVDAEAHEEFGGRPLPKELKQAIASAFSKLGSARVAVRSSAIAEDSSEASWAGQLETYLNVTSSGLEKAIKKCWASIKTDRVKAYLKGKKVSERGLLVGVVVQAMIPSEVSGVMFTVDPISNNKNQMIIEATYGLGELLVQGAVTPDRFVVNRKSGLPEAFDISVKQKQIVFKSGKNRVVRVPEDKEDRATLREEQLVELTKLGERIEKIYKTPQDIEWALYKGKFYITQARPITTL